MICDSHSLCLSLSGNKSYSFRAIVYSHKHLEYDSFCFSDSECRYYTFNGLVKLLTNFDLVSKCDSYYILKIVSISACRIRLPRPTKRIDIDYIYANYRSKAYLNCLNIVTSDFSIYIPSSCLLSCNFSLYCS